MKRLATLCIVMLCVGPARAADPDTRPEPPKPGRDFQSADTRRLEDDDAANPGLLWLEKGRALWSEPTGTAGTTCAGCHGAIETGMRGVAARHPAVDAKDGHLRNLEQQINRCRTERQSSPALAYESDDLLGLTAAVTSASRGLPRSVATDAAARPFLDQGRAFFFERQGQLNLACANCHNDNWGRMLRGDRISQGQSDGWPAYRIVWQTFGSLHRRLRACSLGVRAEVLDYGAPEYVAVELYLAARGRELPVSSPGVRR